MLRAGIIGLPNVGKSTLFNAITKKKILIANYPFATIEPNVGVVLVEDKRLIELSNMYNPNKTIFSSYEFVDIAGLIKGASKGEGLGNKFLGHIRNVDAICEVIRCFDDEKTIHVEGDTNPIRDIETIEFELIMADLEIVENRLNKIFNKVKSSKDKEEIKEYETLNKIKENLMKEVSIRNINLTDEEIQIIRNFNFLTLKPIIYLANIREEDINKENKYVKLLKEKVNGEVIEICAKIESELNELEDEEKEKYLRDIGLEESGLNRLIKSTYKVLGLSSFFTVGKDECRAWTFKNGMSAKECAGIIHSDFEKGFIRAEIMSYKDLIDYKSEVKVKEAGKMRLEGKEYKMKDGDICYFRFNI